MQPWHLCQLAIAWHAIAVVHACICHPCRVPCAHMPATAGASHARKGYGTARKAWVLGAPRTPAHPGPKPLMIIPALLSPLAPLLWTTFRCTTCVLQRSLPAAKHQCCRLATALSPNGSAQTATSETSPCPPRDCCWSLQTHAMPPLAVLAAPLCMAKVRERQRSFLRAPWQPQQLGSAGTMGRQVPRKAALPRASSQCTLPRASSQCTLPDASSQCTLPRASSQCTLPHARLQCVLTAHKWQHDTGEHGSGVDLTPLFGL